MFRLCLYDLVVYLTIGFFHYNIVVNCLIINEQDIIRFLDFNLILKLFSHILWPSVICAVHVADSLIQYVVFRNIFLIFCPLRCQFIFDLIAPLLYFVYILTALRKKKKIKPFKMKNVMHAHSWLIVIKYMFHKLWRMHNKCRNLNNVLCSWQITCKIKCINRFVLTFSFLFWSTDDYRGLFCWVLHCSVFRYFVVFSVLCLFCYGN